MIDVVITGYLGPSVTISTVDLDSKSRSNAMLSSVEQLFDFENKIRLHLVLTGDHESCNQFCLLLTERAPVGLDLKFTYFSQDEEDLTRGKGWLEVQLLRKFLATGALIGPFFLKITSKYMINNIGTVIDFCSRAKCCIGWSHVGRNMVDTRVVLLSKEALLSRSLDDIHDASGYYLEHALYDYVRNSGQTLLFFCRPIVKGLSGSTGQGVEMGFFKKMTIYFSTFVLGRFFNV